MWIAMEGKFCSDDGGVNRRISSEFDKLIN
jgi:hypothetical protein